MVRRKRVEKEIQVSSGEGKVLLGDANRAQRIVNVVTNVSVLLMSTMMGAFSQIMVDTTGAVASGMAGALGGEEAGEKVEKEMKQKLIRRNYRKHNFRWKSKMKRCLQNLNRNICKRPDNQPK